ncbi:hypothetical protein K2X85_01235 [bacterium]|nr:hypothetical protein [bacterium]
MTSSFASGRTRAGGNLFLLVAVVVAVSAAWVAKDYFAYRADSRSHWTSFYHDRHAHAAYAMDMGDSLRHGDLIGLANVLQRNIVWPPVHGVISALAMLTFGFDHRIVILPAMLGWGMLLVFGPLTARALCRDPVGATAATAFTWLMLAQSPAYRSYSTECLLEGLGAGLTALCLFLYVQAKNDPDRRAAWLRLAIGLTVLFFEKSNYWLIVMAGLVLAELVGHLAHASSRARMPSLIGNSLRIIHAELKQPLFWSGLFLAMISVAVALRGPTWINLFGSRVSLYPPGTIVLLAYICLFIRGVSLVRRHGWLREEISGPTISALLAGLVSPIAISFLLPKRLLLNLWFLSPSNAGESAARPIFEAIEIYSRTVVEDYHTHLLLALLAGGLLLVTLFQARRLAPASWGIIAVLTLAVLLILLHPNQKARFLHSWLATLWIVGGIGLGMLWSLRLPRAVPTVATISCLLLAAVGVGSSWSSPRMMVDQQPGPALMDLSDWYLTKTTPGDRVAIICTQPDVNFFGWTFRERESSVGSLEKDNWLWWPIETPEAMQAEFSAWLARTSANTVVLIDVPPTSPHYRAVQHPYPVYGMLPGLMMNQTEFEKVAGQTIESCQVSIWRRAEIASKEVRSNNK